MRQISLIAAIIAAKVSMWLSRLSGKGKGSSLPGLVALKIYPGVLKALAGQIRRGIILVTGTNGKTTTNNLITGILEKAGYKVLANIEGANLISGITAAFIKKVSLRGKIKCDYACLEVDEASFPRICREINPDLVLVTNFFRDQLDRYGELDKTIKMIQDTLKEFSEVKLILNADDPLVAQLQINTGLPALFYGLGGVIARKESSVREARFCPFCGASLLYKYYYYSQLGNYYCTACGFIRPLPDVQAIEINTENLKTSCRVSYFNKNIYLRLPVYGLYNLYNALAAFSTGLLFKIKPEKLIQYLESFIPATGRMEHYYYSEKFILLNLVKNPAGFNETLAVLMEDRGYFDVLIALNDQDADGRDVSWIWDVDFEVLKEKGNINFYICSGLRAEEMGVRLKYAGIPPGKIKIEPGLKTAVRRVLEGPSQKGYLLATYTALWPIEKELRKYCHRGYLNVANMSSVS